MTDTPEQEATRDSPRATRRRVLQATAGALAVGAVSGRGAAQASGPTVYVGSNDDNLYAVDAATGTGRWVFDTGSEVKPSPTVVDGTVYVGSGSFGDGGTLYAVDAATGSEQWAFDAGDYMRSSPTVVGGIVYIGAGLNLYSVDAVTGTERWTFETGGSVDPSPTVVDGTVYVGSFGGDLYAVDAATGTEEWARNLETGSNRDTDLSSPTVVDGTVYVGTSEFESEGDNLVAVDGALYAIDATTGSDEWTFETGTVAESAPTVVDGTVYVGFWDDNLYAVDAGTGEQEWAFETGGDVDSSPTVVDGTVYVGSEDSRLYAVDAGTGDQEWAFDAGSEVESSPTVVDGTVYFGSDDSNLYAVDARTGEQEWAFTQPSRLVESSPTVVNDPGSGDSIGSRVNLGTLGHHNVFAENGPTPPGGGPGPGSPSWSFTAQTSTGPVQPGETFRIFPMVTNTGTATSGATVEFLGSYNREHNADYYGDQFNIESHTDAGGDWFYEGWAWGQNTGTGPISPGGARNPSVEIMVADDVSAGEYTFVMSGPDRIEAAATIEVRSVPDDGVVADYDLDGDGNISVTELGRAAADYARGDINVTQLGEVAQAYASTSNN